MDRLYYRLSEAARFLTKITGIDFTEHSLISEGADGFIPIHVLTDGFRVTGFKRRYDQTVTAEHGVCVERLARVSTDCLREFESNPQHTEARLAPIPCYIQPVGPMPHSRLESNGLWRDGEALLRLEYRHVLYPPVDRMNVALANRNISFDQYLAEVAKWERYDYHPVLLKDCVLVIKADDMDRTSTRHEFEVQSQCSEFEEGRIGGAASTDDLDTSFHYLIKRWLFDFWVDEGKPDTRFLFRRLKKMRGVKGCPVVEHWGAGSKDGGFRWKIGESEGNMTYKRLGNMVAEDFKKPVNRKK